MIFQRAALREFANNAVAVFIALFAILLTVILIRLLSQAAGGRVPADALLALIGFSAINHLPLVLSLSLFISILMAMTRSYRDSEMVVWFSAGLPLWSWINPVLRFTLPCVVLIGGFSLFLSPWAQKQATEYRTRLDNRDDVARIAPGVFLESTSSNRVFFVESVSEDQTKIKNVFIHSAKQGRLTLTVATHGILETHPNGDRFVVLFKGKRYEGTPSTPSYRVTEFERYAVRIEQTALGGDVNLPKAMSTLKLLSSSDKVLRSELVWRIGLPIAAVLLALLAIPLSFVNPRAPRSNNILFAILGFTVYVNLLGVCQAWVAQGKLSFGWGLWLTHLVMIVILLVLFGRKLLPNLTRRTA